MPPLVPLPSDLDALLERQNGVVTVDQAVRHIGGDVVRWRVRSGRWQSLQRGVLVAQSGPLSERQRLWADLLRAGRGAVLAGLSAARLDGLDGFTTAQTCVLVPHGRQVRGADIDVRSSTRLGDTDVHPLRTSPRTRLPRSIVDAASWAGTARQAGRSSRRVCSSGWSESPTSCSSSTSSRG